MPIPAPSQVDTCNGALRRARAGNINDINENSPQALECRLQYPKIVSKLLELHPWSFLRQRIQMAEAGSNDRVYQWAYAYLLPSNCAQPIGVLPDFADAGFTEPVHVFYVKYEVLDDILYTNAQNAWLDYTIANITGVLVTRAFADAIEVELAYRIAMSLKGDAALKKDLAVEKELMLQQAIAVDRDRQPEEWGNYESEAMRARHRHDDWHHRWDCW